MSNLASAAAALPGVPEDLVQRSADARAAATGGTSEDILAAWGGGASAPQPSPAAAAVPAEAPQAASAPATAVLVEETPITVVEPAVVIPEEPEEIVEPAATRRRLKKGRQLGLGFGLGAGLVALMLGLLVFIPTLAVVDGVVVGLVAPRKVVFGMALLLGAAGWLIAGAVARIPAAIDKTFFLDSSSKEAKTTGVVTGLALGLALGTLIKKSGTADVLDPSLFTLPLMSSLVTAVLGAGVIGAVTGLLVQLVGLPDADDSEDDH